MKWRAAAGALLIALLMPTVARGQQRWYEAYEDALRAIDRKDWAAAEARLKTALQSRTTQGRHVRTYGTQFVDYIPEYYLAVVYANTRRYQQALDLFAKVQQAKLVIDGSPEYVQLKQHAQAAKDALAAPQVAGTQPPAAPTALVETPPAAAAGAPSREPPAISRPPGETTSAATADLERRERFATLLIQVTADVDAGRLEAARSRAEEARATGVDSARAAEVLRRIDATIAERDAQAAVRRRDWPEAQRLRNVLRDLEPGHARLRELDAAIAKGLTQASVADVERSALRAFYSGDYAMAILLLERVQQAGASPRAFFYLACSHAAIGLLEGAQGTARLQQARELYAKARPSQNRFAPDRRYISPRILQALDPR